MKKLVVFLLLLNAGECIAQDPAFSQFFSNQLYLNPAFAGIRHDTRMGSNYRTQWNGIPGKFKTYNAWADIYNPFLNGGFGLIALQDVEGEGALQTSSFGFIQSFEVLIPKILRLRAGYNVTVTNKKIDWYKLVFSDQLDGLQGQIYSTAVMPGNSQGTTFADFSAGAMVDLPEFKKIPDVNITSTMGATLSHLTEPNDALSGSDFGTLPRKFSFHLTTTIQFLNYVKDNKPFYISPNFIFERQQPRFKNTNEKQAEFQTTNVGFYVMRSPMMSGVFYRNTRYCSGFKDQDSFILFLGFTQPYKKTKIFRMGYSYDFTINHLATNTMGSHELSVSMEFTNKKLIAKKLRLRKRKKREIECTDFGERSFVF